VYSFVRSVIQNILSVIAFPTLTSAVEFLHEVIKGARGSNLVTFVILFVNLNSMKVEIND